MLVDEALFSHKAARMTMIISSEAIHVTRKAWCHMQVAWRAAYGVGHIVTYVNTSVMEFQICRKKHAVNSRMSFALLPQNESIQYVC